MSTFQISLEIGDIAQENFESIDAWVDTGASYTLMPRLILDRLGYSPTFQRSFRLADGSAVELDGCRVYLRINQEIQFTLCIFGDNGSEPLLGATALEEFSLGVDPVNHALVPVVSNLLSFNPEAYDNDNH
jgi:clan AA aspartic protease